jgi:hypothetical protein
MSFLPDDCRCAGGEIAAVRTIYRNWKVAFGFSQFAIYYSLFAFGFNCDTRSALELTALGRVSMKSAIYFASLLILSVGSRRRPIAVRAGN